MFALCPFTFLSLLFYLYPKIEIIPEAYLSLICLYFLISLFGFLNTVLLSNQKKT